VEIAELDSFYRADLTRIKSVITSRTDNYRAPYDRVSLDHPRMSVFAGTTNEKLWSRDQTGARRFWPIECKAVRLDKIATDRSQLFAEAVELYKKKENWWMMPKAETEAEQEARRQSDEWETIIYDFLVNRDEISVATIAKECLNISVDKLERGVQMRIAGIVKNLGFEKRHRNVGGNQGKIWCRQGSAQLL